MSLRATTALAALAALVLAASAVPLLPFTATSGKAAKSSCGTHPSGAAQHASDVRLAALLVSKLQHLRISRADNSAATQARLFSIADQAQLLVPVKFFVMHSGNTGKVKRSQIEDQIRVLDKGFSGAQSGGVQPDTRVRFKLESVEYVDKQAYYKQCVRNQQKIANEYVKEPEKYVHVIVCRPPGLLGSSTLPEDAPEGSSDHYIQLDAEVLPGGNEDGKNQGDTLLHEVGHYFGLEHTFEKGCSGQGDYVSDTPAAKKANEFCKKVDSCPNKPGNDAIDNFMDYTPDTCMDRFSPGQAWRMRMQLNEHKPGGVKRWTVQGGGGVATTKKPVVVAATTKKPVVVGGASLVGDCTVLKKAGVAYNGPIVAKFNNVGGATPITDVAECAQKCAENAECTYFAVNKSPSKGCVLKSNRRGSPVKNAAYLGHGSCEHAVPAGCATTGAGQGWSMFKKNNLGSYKNIKNEGGCAQKCSDNAECKYWLVHNRLGCVLNTVGTGKVQNKKGYMFHGTCNSK